MCEFVCAFLSSIPFYGSSAIVSLPIFQSTILDLVSRSRASFSALVLSLKYMANFAVIETSAATAATPRALPTVYTTDPRVLYRLYVAALMTATKYLEDNTFTNKAWSEIALVPLHELNHTEMSFLLRLKFEIHVAEGDYSKWLASLLDFATSKNSVAVAAASSGSNSSVAGTPTGSAPASPTAFVTDAVRGSSSSSAARVSSRVSTMAAPLSPLPSPPPMASFAAPAPAPRQQHHFYPITTFQQQPETLSPESSAEILSSLKRRRTPEVAADSGSSSPSPCSCLECLPATAAAPRPSKLVKLAGSQKARPVARKYTQQRPQPILLPPPHLYTPYPTPPPQALANMYYFI